MTSIAQFAESTAYQCTADLSGGKVVFGRIANSAPTTGCSDPYIYTAVMGQSTPGASQAKTDLVAKFQYDGCTTELNLIYAQYVQDASGTATSSTIFDMNGFVATHRFKARGTAYEPGITNPVWSLAANGVSLGTSSANGYFILGYDKLDTAGVMGNWEFHDFCVQVGTTAGSFTAVTSTAGTCQAYEASYVEVNHPYSYANLPTKTSITLTAADFGVQ